MEKRVFMEKVTTYLKEVWRGNWELSEPISSKETIRMLSQLIYLNPISSVKTLIVSPSKLSTFYVNMNVKKYEQYLAFDMRKSLYKFKVDYLCYYFYYNYYSLLCSSRSIVYKFQRAGEKNSERILLRLMHFKNITSTQIDIFSLY